ncbi:MAG: hypothetical protein RBT76_12390 [candidate division Zixibacteria bacterium]|jgi:hypothetical protein|nr:hypothetical protein [candidate division Zixibacteria bacterium]
MNFQADTYTLTDRGGFANKAMIAGAVGLLVTVLAWFLDSARFYHAWLTAFAFWITVSLGALFFTMLHHLTGAQWSTVIRRLAESLLAPFPLLAVFFIPIILGMHDLYHWTHEDAVAHSHLLQLKQPYLNQTFFIIRAVVYFAVWIFLSMRLVSLSRRQDQGHSADILAKMRSTSAWGMILFAVTITYAGFDWLMSMAPEWYSTIFGVYIFSGGLLSAMCLITLTALALRRRGVLDKAITHEHYHDLGKLVFGFIIFWGYIGFSQYMLIWYANIPEETVWYLARWEGSWKAVSLLLVLGYFAIPFLIMIFRGTKRALAPLGVMVAWLLVMHWVDLYWLVFPTWPGATDNASFHWMDLSAMLAIGGFYLWSFWSRFSRGPLVPVGDPKLPQSLSHVNY